MEIKNKKVVHDKKGRPKKNPAYVIIGEEAVIYGKDGRHVVKRFKVTQKEIDGKITMILIPWKELNKRRKELTKKLSEKLAENVNAKDLMKDILDDTPFNKLEQLNDAIDRGAEVKSKEGCYYLEIKDKRRKKPLQLQVRK